ncbi:hypothetical protein [Arcobacter sp. FWKO B]|uniref:hypothetical protein n=1 Tax=Arcobacter sp. FWKO B TaxID=2593672 RepID=UPI0018A36555|nr:hypothetical protein [Arcobacter sp. FWKO B]QOG11224.1 hypothetical protein FWKOB_00320 [Arcobacter sp. FWKO B]
MRVFLLLMFILSTISYASNSDEFKTHQTLIQKVKQAIEDEEAIARAYEKYLLEEFAITSDISDLLTSSYLGSSFVDLDLSFFNTFVLFQRGVNYRLKNHIKENLSIKALYESDTFRKKTFYYNNAVYFTLEDDFAKNLFTLITKQSSKLLECGEVPKRKYCQKDNHIYIYDDDAQTDLLIYYHKDNFKIGPIMITNNALLYDTKEEFKFIPTGAALYDINGVIYVKTPESIQRLK